MEAFLAVKHPDPEVQRALIMAAAYELQREWWDLEDEEEVDGGDE